MAHGDAREGKWRGNWRMEWVASTVHTTSVHGVSSITTADAHTSAASSRLNWRPRWFKWTPPFRRKTKSGFCVCAITFQTQSTILCQPAHILNFPPYITKHSFHNHINPVPIMSKELNLGCQRGTRFIMLLLNFDLSVPCGEGRQPCTLAPN